ncbi:hypothetical protein RHD99_13585 [Buttiauxella selenatireducens]|uniref:Chromosome partitioning protein ParB n=1 Tax=Buttiauxella selenatireducens TaxID=3073902 RepID=A0ABY9S690_9ENTR|nr:ParB family protein [Buttiauxella sp. R73]WMY72518.1 hypothetical protein RHD99_13585 [Buttiauxella sp. R73]
MINNTCTVISVTLDKLRAFDLNPRLVRNPKHDDIKASIRQRGLMQLPLITQRPSDAFYIIAGGGNTRLAVLNELWLETHAEKYWNIDCYYQPWQTEKSVDEGNLDCLLGHLIENEKRGALTFIERALGVQKATEIYQKINPGCSQTDKVSMLQDEGYCLSQTQLSVMIATIHYLLPYIPEHLYNGLARKHINELLALRNAAQKYWESHTSALPSESEHLLPLFEDVFALALFPFSDPGAGFQLKHILDELTGTISQKLGVHYNIVAMEIDTRSIKRSAFFGTEPIPVLPDVAGQRHMALKPRGKNLTVPEVEPSATDTVSVEAGCAETSAALEVDDDGSHAGRVATAENIAIVSPSELSGSSAAGVDTVVLFSPHPIPLYDEPEALASVIEQAAWEFAENAGLEFLIAPTEHGVFDIREPGDALSGEQQIYWQMLAFLADKLPGSAIEWRQMLLGTPLVCAELSDESLATFVQLLHSIRHLYALQRQESRV